MSDISTPTPTSQPAAPKKPLMGVFDVLCLLVLFWVLFLDGGTQLASLIRTGSAAVQPAVGPGVIVLTTPVPAGPTIVLPPVNVPPNPPPLTGSFGPVGGAAGSAGVVPTTQTGASVITINTSPGLPQPTPTVGYPDCAVAQPGQACVNAPGLAPIVPEPLSGMSADEALGVWTELEEACAMGGCPASEATPLPNQIPAECQNPVGERAVRACALILKGVIKPKG